LDFTQTTFEPVHRLEPCVDGVETGVELCQGPALDPSLRSPQEVFHGP
jgi:hypothetical protein